jgi:SAM-dependent methyltransferase
MFTPYFIGEVTGLDFSENMLEVGKEKTKSMPNIHLVHGDATNLLYHNIHQVLYFQVTHSYLSLHVYAIFYVVRSKLQV